MNNTLLDTRISLLTRLSNKQDIEAWDQFVEIYQPFVFRLARSKGFQEADAHDLVQEVLLAVSKAVHRWDPDQGKGRFRDWLFRIARNLMINFLTRRQYQSLSVSFETLAFLDQQPAQEDSGESREFDLEYRREMFFIAADRVSKSVRPKTWDAFQLTSMEQRTIQQAASQLQMTEGAVLVARCRVLARLRETVKRLSEENQNS